MNYNFSMTHVFAAHDIPSCPTASITHSRLRKNDRKMTVSLSRKAQFGELLVVVTRLFDTQRLKFRSILARPE
jgi:hypothetical protein